MQVRVRAEEAQASGTGRRPRRPARRSSAGARRRLAAGMGACVLLFAGCGLFRADWLGLGPEELQTYAQEAFDRGDYGDAAGALDHLRTEYPAFATDVPTLLLLAEAYYRDEQYLRAASEFERVRDRFFTHPRAPEAALGVCRSYAALSPIPDRDQEYTLTAISECGLVVRSFPGMPQAQDADSIGRAMVGKLAEKDFVIADGYERNDEDDSAIVYYEQVAARYPGTDWAPRALLRIYHIYRERRWDEEAEEVRARILEDYPDSPAARELNGGGG